MNQPFALQGASVVIGTMHGKERVLAPVLAGLGMRVLPVPDLDTDRFGTFTRETARAGSQREALLAKARAALALVPEADFAVASEGAFGPHPQAPFLAAGLEMVGMIERASGAAITGEALCVETNFAQSRAATAQEAQAFAQRIGFPEHALVVMATPEGPVLAKGVTDGAALSALLEQELPRHEALWLEADMRAHFNPTRMRAIAAAAQDLARRLAQRCPRCGHPGFVASALPGRPCAWCSAPTGEAFKEVRLCQPCGYREERVTEPERGGDPAACPLCNP